MYIFYFFYKSVMIFLYVNKIYVCLSGADLEYTEKNLLQFHSEYCCIGVYIKKNINKVEIKINHENKKAS